MKRMWEVHGSVGMSQEEYLSRFEKCGKLQPVITLVFYYGEKDMIQFLENNKEYFSAVDLETYNIIRLLLDLKNVLNEREETDYKEGYDMCKAFDDWYAEAVQLGHEDGMKLGIEQGVERGAAKNLLENIQKIMSKGCSFQEACELVEVTFAEYEAAKELSEAVPVGV